MPTSTDTIESQSARALLPDPDWSRVERLQLIRREVREVLAPSSLEALFAYAECVVEGGRDSGPAGAGGYATVMLTIDLNRCTQLFRDRSDAATAERIVELLVDHRWVRRRLGDLARPELERWVGPLASRDVVIEMRARAEGTRIFVDGDAMAHPARSRAGGSGTSARRRGGAR